MSAKADRVHVVGGRTVIGRSAYLQVRELAGHLLLSVIGLGALTHRLSAKVRAATAGVPLVSDQSRPPVAVPSWSRLSASASRAATTTAMMSARGRSILAWRTGSKSKMRLLAAVRSAGASSY